jgi:hypothetical protein
MEWDDKELYCRTKYVYPDVPRSTLHFRILGKPWPLKRNHSSIHVQPTIA